MLELIDGRKQLYQWDTGRIASVSIDCDVVHFSQLLYGDSLAVRVDNGRVNIPNQLLLTAQDIHCWAIVADENGNYTKREQTLPVAKRAKPADYLYTETEIISVQRAVEDGLQEAKESGDFKGEKGDKGDRGEKGEKGDKGDRGEKGADGLSVSVTVDGDILNIDTN